MKKFLDENYYVVMADLKSELIEEAIEKKGLDRERIMICPLDITDENAVARGIKEIASRFGRIDTLVNAAGICGSYDRIVDYSFENFRKVYEVNVFGTFLMIQNVIPEMLKRAEGSIVNFGSVSGMRGYSFEVGYGSSKWAVIGWSDSVRIELQESGSNVHITTVAPYYINTGMFDGVRSRLFPILDPERTSRKILKAIENNTNFRGLPWSSHFIRFWQAVLPSAWFDTIMGHWVGIYTTMDHFTGRK